MGLLVAGLGHVDPARWGDLVQETACFAGSDFRDWHDADTGVRLGIAGPEGTLRAAPSPSVALVAVGAGFVDGAKDVAAAALAAYRGAGPAGLAGLRGQYSFALWDGATRSLLVGSDAVGLQAPAYMWDGTRFLLSSRAMALVRAGTAPPVWDPVYVAHAFGGLWSRTTSATAFRGIRRTVGGEILEVSTHGLRRLSWNRLSFEDARALGTEGAVDELGDRLDRAVASMAGDRGTCVALSGGIDSCVVASALAKTNPALDAFSLVAPGESRVENQAVANVVRAFPGMRHHRVEVSGVAEEWSGSSPLFDDPICAGPVLQPGRMALLRTIREAGFERVLDGEGGDELFDMAWWPRDLVRDLAWAPVLGALGSRAPRSRMVRDIAASGALGYLSARWERRRREDLRARRPWLREAFWASPSLAEAWEETRAYQKLPSVPERLTEILGAHGRYHRAQSLARLCVGVEGSSPLVDRTVVELVGSLRAEVVMDPRHGKALLRRLAARRVSPAVAWRPKVEPLSDWLIKRYLSAEPNVRRAADLIDRSAMLRELVDVGAAVAAVDRARREQHPALSTPLVELLLLVEWFAAVEKRYGL
jgi:asparagine synthetase B (glutamine-hydrolysing)